MVVGAKYLPKMITMYMIDKKNIRRWKYVILGVEKIWYSRYSIVVQISKMKKKRCMYVNYVIYISVLILVLRLSVKVIL